MKNLNNFKQILSLATSEDQHLSKRKPEFWQRYHNEIDKFDFDLEALANYERVFKVLAEHYFRIQVRGVENIPAEGSVILVGNHSGTIPIDALMTFECALSHSSPRRFRYLVLPWFKKIAPIWQGMSQLGAVEANFSNALTLLEDQEILGIYPEAERAMTKSWNERYRLREFDPGFIKLAIATRTPIVPVITVGAEESFPNFGNWEAMAKFLGMPIFPFTLTFPWLPFPFAFTPLPVRWHIRFGQPIYLDYSPDRSFDTGLVTRLAEEVRQQIQQELDSILKKRKSIMAGWNEEDLDAEVMRCTNESLLAKIKS